jgi:phosphatidylinositol glycan class W
MTLFADHPGTLSAALLLPTGFICFIFPPHQSGTPLPSSGTFPTRTPSTSRPASDSPNDKRQRISSSRVPAETTRLPALSTYRAHMMLVTVLAILAVDFPVFPRALAKCETYGVSFVRPVFLLFRVFNPF